MIITRTVRGGTELKRIKDADPPAADERSHRPPAPGEVAAGGDRDLMALMGFAAGLSRVSYAENGWSGDDAGVPKLLRDVGASEVEFVAAAGSRALLVLLDGRAWIAFRGTCHLADWGANLTLIPALHIGFRRRYARLSPLIQRWLTEHRERISAVVVTGHSKGGALAILAARDFAQRNDLPLEAVLTFAAPRVLGPRAAARYDAMRVVGSTAEIRLCEITHRAIYREDVVPKVPFALFGFRHVGREWTLSELGRIVPKDWKPALRREAASPLTAVQRSFLAIRASVAQLADHNPLARAANDPRDQSKALAPIGRQSTGTRRAPGYGLATINGLARAAGCEQAPQATASRARGLHTLGLSVDSRVSQQTLGRSIDVDQAPTRFVIRPARKSAEPASNQECSINAEGEDSAADEEHYNAD